MLNRKFQRKQEDFTCEHCGLFVKGNGYTNHCLKCLWSKHVDVYPGDRAETCGGLMRPVGLEQRRGNFLLTHRCEKCGFERRNKTTTADTSEALLGLTETMKKKLLE